MLQHVGVCDKWYFYQDCPSLSALWCSLFLPNEQTKHTYVNSSWSHTGDSHHMLPADSTHLLSISSSHPSPFTNVYQIILIN